MSQSSRPGRYVFDDRPVKPATDGDGYQAERRGVTPHQGFPGDALALRAQVGNPVWFRRGRRLRDVD